MYWLTSPTSVPIYDRRLATPETLQTPIPLPDQSNPVSSGIGLTKDLYEDNESTYSGYDSPATPEECTFPMSPEYIDVPDSPKYIIVD